MPIKRTDNSASILAKQKAAIILGLLSVSELMATKVQDETPVQTGYLKAHIKSTGKIEYAGKNKLRTKITTPVNYAPHVEFGTKKMAPRAMFRKGIGNNTKLFTDTFAAIVRLT